MSENRILPPGVRQGNDGKYTCLVADDGTRIQLCGVWYLDADDGVAQKVIATQNGFGIRVCVCSKCGTRVAFEDDRYCRKCGRRFER